MRDLSRGSAFRFVSRLRVPVAALCAAACASSLGSSALGGTDSKLISFARGLNIVPASPRACPGESVGATYEVRIAGGTTLALTESDVAALERRGTLVEPAHNGGWRTNPDPLASAATGFRLHAALGRDTTVKGDTVLVPNYDCHPLAWEVRGGEFVGEHAHVRLGTVKTPFYDSVVVAALEIPGRAPVVGLLGPGSLRSGAIRINAPGRSGAPGRDGKTGQNGSECSDGGDGTDGDPGRDGAPGGQVDVIVEAGSNWLADLVSVQNPGGHGGAGGRPGAGGAPGTPARGSEKTCAPKAGRAGRPGIRGNDAPSGLPPVVTSIPRSLLWSGSPLWSDSTARATLSALIELSAKTGGSQR
jgi:hypothetical protein